MINRATYQLAERKGFRTAIRSRMVLYSTFFFIVLIGGCGSSSQFITLGELAEEKPERIQISTTDGRIFQFDTYALTQYEIVGVGYEVKPVGTEPFSGKIPITSITSILNLQTRSHGSGLLIVLGIILGSIGLFFLIILLTLFYS